MMLQRSRFVCLVAAAVCCMAAAPLFAQQGKVLLQDPFESLEPGARDGFIRGSGAQLVEGVEGSALQLTGETTVFYPAAGKVDPAGGELSFRVRLDFDPNVKTDNTRTIWRNQNFVGFIGEGNRRMVVYTCLNDISVLLQNADRNFVFAKRNGMAMAQGEWIDIAVRWGEQVELIVNGETVMTQPQAGLFGAVPFDPATGRIAVGGIPGGGIESQMTIDELVIRGPAPGQITPRPRISMPRLDGAPTIDGNLDDAFWSNAGLVSGFGGASDNRVVADQPRIMTAYTDEGLLFGMAVPLADERTPQAALTGHDAAVYSEDSVEVYLQPPGDIGRFYQFIISAAGVQFDARRANRDARSEKEWNATWQSAAHREPGLWTAEVFVPFASLDGMTPPDAQQLWRGNFCVNYTGTTQINGCTWAPTSGNYQDDARFGEMLLTDSPRAMRQDSFTGFHDGMPATSLRVVGPLTPIVQVHTRLVDDTGKEVFAKQLSLRDSPAAEISSDFLPSGVYSLDSTAVEDDGRVLWRQSLQFETAVAFSLDVEVYPTNRQGMIIANVKGSRDPVDAVAATITAVDNRAAGSVRIDQFRNGEGRGAFDIADLPPGEYMVTARALGADGSTLHDAQQRFTIYPEPDWLRNDLGIDHSVPGPYEPVVFADGSVNVWGRKHAVGDNVIASNIVNQGVAMFTEPMAMTLTVGGETIDLTTIARDSEDVHDDVVTLSGSQTVGGAAVTCEAGYEFDGCIRLDLSIVPDGEATVEQLQFDLPLPAQLAKFLLLSTGWSGSVMEVTGPIDRAFTPLIWLGNDDMGLCFFAESDQWWQPRDEARLQIIPDGDRTILRVNIVTEPLTINEPMTMTLGLMATPVRDVPAGDPFYHIQMRAPDAPITFPEFCEYAGGDRYPAQAGTIEFQMRRSTAGSPRPQVLHLFGGGGRPAYLYVHNDSLIVLSDGKSWYAKGEIDLSAGRYTHVAMTWDDQNLSLYADGKRIDHVEMTDELRALIAKPANDDGAIRIGCGNYWRGWTAIVVDNLRLSRGVRYEGEQIDIPAGPITTDDATIIADTFNDDFLPDGEDAHTPGGGTPTLGCRFVDGADGNALRIEVAPARPGMQILREVGVDLFCDWQTWNAPDKRYTPPLLYDIGDPTVYDRVDRYRRYGIRTQPYFAYPAMQGKTWVEDQFADEWCIRPYAAMPFGVQMPGYYMINANPGGIGYANYQAAGLKWIIDEFGYEGFYTDGVTNFPADHNAAHGAGYIDENGNRRPTYTVFAIREAMKRLYRIAKDHHPHGLNVHHSSFTLNIPLVSMGDIYYTGEHEDYTNQLNARVRFNGKAWGVWAVLLGSSKHVYESLHMMVGLLHGTGQLTADVQGRRDWSRKYINIINAYRRFGYRSATWLPYFKAEGEYYTGDDPDVKVSMYVHPGRAALMVVGSYAREPRDATVTLNLEQLGVAGVPFTVHNALTGQSLAADEHGELHVHIAAQSFVLVELRTQ